jgi:hypothetical protein
MLLLSLLAQRKATPQKGQNIVKYGIEYCLRDDYSCSLLI